MRAHIERWQSLTLSPADRAILDQMKEDMITTKIYAELDAAQNEVKMLEMQNSRSLDTPEKRLAWDVAYQRATGRLYRALTTRADLVMQMASGPRD